MYIVNYYIKDADRQNAFLAKAKELGDVEVYLPEAALFLNSKNKCADIYKELKTCTKDSDLFFVAGLNENDMNGWLTTKSIDWLLKKNNKL